MPNTNRNPIYSGRVVNLGLESVVLPNGDEVELEIVRHQGAAAVVPVHENGDITLIHQYRHAAGGKIYELPAGLWEKGETLLECATRELAEETGLGARHLVQLGEIHTTPGFTDEKITLFIGLGAYPVPSSGPEYGECISQIRLPLTEALIWVQTGKITDAKTIVGLHLAAIHTGVFNLSKIS